MRILSGRARFAGRSSLKTWLFGVIRYAAMEEMRRRALWSARSVDVARAIDVADPADGAQRMVEQAEQRAALRLALESLSPRQRESLQLVFYHGMTIEEAAGVMQISTGAARTHYDRGKKTLAKRLSRKDR